MAVLPGKSVFPRWLAVTFGGIILAIVAGGTCFYYIQQRNLHKNLDDELLAIGRSKASQITQWRSDRLADGGEIMASPFYCAKLAAWAASPTPESTQEILTRFQGIRQYHGCRNVFQVDLDGNILLSLDNAPNDLATEAEKGMERAFEAHAPILTDLHFFEDGTSPHCDVIAPLFTRESTPFGATVLCFDAEDFLYPLLQSWPIPTTTGESLLVRREGDSILFLNELRHKQKTTLALRVPLGQRELPAVMAVLGEEGVVEGHDYRGVDVVAAILPIPDSSWFLVTKIDQAEAFSTWKFQSRLILALILVLVMAVLALIGALWQRGRRAYYRALYEGERERQALLRHFEYLVKYANDIILLYDEETRIVEANDKALASYGYTRDELTALSKGDLLAAEERPLCKERMRRAKQNGSLLCETVHMRKNGELFPVEVSVRWIEVEGKQYIQEIIRDITERKNAQEALQVRQRAIECSINAVVLSDLEGTVLYANPSFLAMWGYENVTEVTGRPLAQFWVFDSSAENAIATIRERGSWIGEATAMKKSGETFCTQSLVAVVRDNLGTPISLMGSFMDITAQKRAEKILSARLHLIQFATTHSMSELLEEVLNRAETLTESFIGFFHFLEADQKTLSLQAWSSRALREMCTATGRGLYYDVESAGVWVDCVRERHSLVQNDVAALPDRKGYPEGHAQVTRELVVPIFRGDRIVGIIGVGNKSLAYDQHDVDVVERLADLAWDIVEQKRSEEALRASEERYRNLVEQMTDLIWRADETGTLTFVSPAVRDLLGYAPEEVVGLPFNTFLAESSTEDAWQTIGIPAHDSSNDTFRTGEFPHRGKHGERFVGEIRSVAIRDAKGHLVGVQGITRDITQRKRLEEQLVQSQKLESVGRLAGGIAHDFNNLLAVILGFGEMLLSNIPPGAPQREGLEDIVQAAERAKELTGQLLAFSRKQVLEMKNVDINQTIRGMEKMLRRIIGENIQIQIQLAPVVGTIRADSAQMTQVLMNLCINARDAMPEGGTISVTTSVARFSERDNLQTRDIRPGSYVVLTVSDTGHGMDEETRRHAFEPFFTTKEQGRGTGLGLAMVFGIVKQHGGDVSVYSEPGHGTTFKLCFPQISAPASSDVQQDADGLILGKGETVLVMEDDKILCRLVQRMVARLGYSVVHASGIDECLELAQKGHQVDLLLTDVIMPDNDGWDIYQQMAKKWPQMKVVFMSGYTGDVITQQGILERGVHFISKPFGEASLSQTLRKALER